MALSASRWGGGESFFRNTRTTNGNTRLHCARLSGIFTVTHTDPPCRSRPLLARPLKRLLPGHGFTRSRHVRVTGDHSSKSLQTREDDTAGIRRHSACRVHAAGLALQSPHRPCPPATNVPPVATRQHDLPRRGLRRESQDTSPGHRPVLGRAQHAPTAFAASIPTVAADGFPR